MGIDSLSRLIRQILSRQLNGSIEPWIKAQWNQIIDINAPLPHPPNLSVWLKMMVDGAKPGIFRPFLLGGKQAAKRIALQLPRSPKFPSLPTAQEIFAAIHPQASAAVDHLTLSFCEETNATSRVRLADALRMLREGLREGLSVGESVPKLSQRVGKIFDDPLRSYTIARTENHRAIHSGQLTAAEESGVVSGMKWIGKREACKKICRPLIGVVKTLGQPFSTEGGKPPYNIILHPPAHPGCTCTVTEEIDPKWLRRVA